MVDTNVVVAGLLTADEDSPVARILDGMLRAAFTYVVSEALLAEYRSVLGRAKTRRAHGLNLEEIEDLLTEIAQHAVVLAPRSGARSPDPGDQFLLDLLSARQDLVLVTGDKVLLGHALLRDRVMTPRDFLGG